MPLAPNVEYVSRCAWLDEVDHVLVVFCSEPRYRESTAEYLDARGLARYDLAVMPGGPAMILQSSFTFTSDRPRIQLLLQEHRVARVIGIAHLNCAYYRHRYENLPPDELRMRQENDLRSFRDEIGGLAPGVAVELYYAEPQDGHVRLTPIE